MLTRKDDINNEEYWKYRLDEAEKANELQYSVYLANKTLWNGIWEKHKEIILSQIPKGLKILDAGCGYGRVSELFDGTKYTGVDFAPSLIGKAKELYPDKTFVIAKLEELPFKDKEFDWSICVSIRKMVFEKSSPEHWDEMEKELKRVSKKILFLEYTKEDEYEII